MLLHHISPPLDLDLMLVELQELGIMLPLAEVLPRVRSKITKKGL